MSIQEALYELYKIDWLHSHMITAERQMDVVRQYYCAVKSGDVDCSLTECIEEYGYDGELYACFDEFMENEYEDVAYIRQLCCNDQMFDDYIDTLID